MPSCTYLFNIGGPHMGTLVSILENFSTIHECLDIHGIFGIFSKEFLLEFTGISYSL